MPRVTPSVDSYLRQHAYDAGQAPAGSAPVTGPARAGQRTRLAGPVPGRPARPAADHLSHHLVAPYRAGLAGQAAASPTASPAHSPVASATGTAGPSPGLHVTSPHPG